MRTCEAQRGASRGRIVAPRCCRQTAAHQVGDEATQRQVTAELVADLQVAVRNSVAHRAIHDAGLHGLRATRCGLSPPGGGTAGLRRLSRLAGLVRSRRAAYGCDRAACGILQRGELEVDLAERQTAAERDRGVTAIVRGAER